MRKMTEAGLYKKYEPNCNYDTSPYNETVSGVELLHIKIILYLFNFTDRNLLSVSASLNWGKV